MERLKPRESQVLQAIIKLSEEKGYPPSVREICDRVGLSSSSSVHSHLKKLERKGYIKRPVNSPRAIKINVEKSCPECGQELIPDSGCSYCPICGWSKCS
jgi:repressor LexA